MVKRSRLEIYFAVLEVIQQGINKPTRIMYETNLSWITLHEIIKQLILCGLIRTTKKGKNNRYYITDKGSSALLYHNKALEGFINIKPS